MRAYKRGYTAGRNALRASGPTRQLSYYRTGDVDEIAVVAALDGRRVRMTIAERKAAVLELTAAGRYAHQIAELLGINTRTVVRYRGDFHKTLHGVCLTQTPDDLEVTP